MEILGCPVKLYINKRAYFPRLYTDLMGIQFESDKLIREDIGDCLIYRKYTERPLLPNEAVTRLRIGNTNLPAAFIQRNKLKPGESMLYLIRIDDTLELSCHNPISLC